LCERREAGGGGGGGGCLTISYPERRRRPGRGIGHRRSNFGVNLIFYLYKINIFFPFI